MTSFTENMAGLLIGLERGLLPDFAVLDDLLDQVTSAEAETVAQMGPDLWRLCTRFARDPPVQIKSSSMEMKIEAEAVARILCALYLLTFRLYRLSCKSNDIQTGLSMFIVALKTLGELTEHHWHRPTTDFGTKIWSTEVYDELLGCLTHLFKTILQPSFLFKSGFPEMLHLVFTYHIVELKLLFIYFYESKKSDVLLDRLAYASSFYMKGSQQDAIVTTILDNISIQPYRESPFRTNLSFVERIFRILKQLFEQKAASKQSLASILRVFADIGILTALMKRPVPLGYGVDFCITKSQELYPCSPAHAVLKVRQVVYHLRVDISNVDSSEAHKLINARVLEAIDLCAHAQDEASKIFTSLSNIISFLTENGFIAAAVSACKSITNHLRTGLLLLCEDGATGNTFPFRALQPKDGSIDATILKRNCASACKLICVTMDSIILNERNISQHELMSALLVLGNIIKDLYIKDQNILSNEGNDFHLFNTKLFNFISVLLSRGDIPSLDLLKFIQGIRCDTITTILVIKYALSELGMHEHRQEDTSPELSQSKKSVQNGHVDNIIDMCTLLLRDIQHSLNDIDKTNDSLVQANKITKCEFYYIFVSVLLEGRDMDSAIELTKTITTLFESDTAPSASDFEIVAAIIGLYIVYQHNTSTPLFKIKMDPDNVLVTLFLVIVHKYLDTCAPHNKYLKLLIEHSIELAYDTIQQKNQSMEYICNIFVRIRDLAERYVDKVGVTRLMKHELEVLQRAFFKLFLLGLHLSIQKTGGATGIPSNVLIYIYKILLHFSRVIEEREVPDKRSFSITNKKNSMRDTDSAMSFESFSQNGSQNFVSVAPLVSDQNTSQSVGLVLYSSNFSLIKRSLLKQNTFASIVCQHIFTCTSPGDEQLLTILDTLSALTDYLTVVCEEYERLETSLIKCGSLSLRALSLGSVFKLIQQFDQTKDRISLPAHTSQTPLVQIFFHYSVLLVLLTAQVALLQGERLASAFTEVVTSVQTIACVERRAELIEHTILLGLEANYQSLTCFLLAKYKTFDPLACVHTYVNSSSRVEVDTLLELLNALVATSERNPAILTNEKIAQIITQLDKLPAQRPEFSQLVAKLKS